MSLLSFSPYTGTPGSAFRAVFVRELVAGDVLIADRGHRMVVRATELVSEEDGLAQAMVCSIGGGADVPMLIPEDRMVRVAPERTDPKDVPVIPSCPPDTAFRTGDRMTISFTAVSGLLDQRWVRLAEDWWHGSGIPDLTDQEMRNKLIVHRLTEVCTLTRTES